MKRPQKKQPSKEKIQKVYQQEQSVNTQVNEQQRDLIYKKLMDDMKEPTQPFEKHIGLKPLQTFSANFDHFNYARGYHYFFDLKTFPRATGSPSYAIDKKNVFNYHYSHENQQINGTNIGKLFNRKYISIPSIGTTFDYKPSKDKNVCHYHLFNIEDKKYQNNRLISKYKYVLKNLQKLHNQDKLKSYTEIKKDIVSYQVCEKDCPLEKKREILKNRIHVLEQRVKSMTAYWNWQDNNYYHFSLDQHFHNLAMAKGLKLSESYLEKEILKRIAYRKEYIENVEFGGLGRSGEKLRHAIETWMIFQEQQNNALSTLMQSRLKSLPKIIEMFNSKKELVIFPLFTFNFGSKDIQRFIDPIIKAKLQKQHKDCFYVYTAFINRILKRDLACQQEDVTEPMNYEQYASQMKENLKDIQKFYDKEIVSHKKVLFADDLIQFQKLQDSPLNQQVHLLEPGHKIEISLKQLMLLFFYRNISIALEQFIEYLHHNPEILKFMADQYYKYFHYSIAKVLHQPEFCILINDVNRFTEILSSKNTCPELDRKICFSFSKKLRIAYAWHEPLSEKWQRINSGQIMEDPKPSKKVKI